MIIVSSGYFAPLHVGHLEYFYRAKQMLPIDDYKSCHKHIVIVNNDEQCKIKNAVFMTQEDRLAIIQNLKTVDEAILSIDKDSTVCETLKAIRSLFIYEDITFVKSGDRFAHEIPEAEVCRYYNIKIVDGLGEKIRNSSEYRSKSIK